MLKLDANGNFRYLKLEALQVIYFHVCDGSQDYPSCAVQTI